MEQLSRTVSAESTRSWTSPHLLAASGASSSPSSRKARSSEPDTTSGNVEHASISMPPPASGAAMARKFSGSGRIMPAVANPDAIMETTPTLEGSRGGSISSGQPLMLPETAYPGYRQGSKQEGDAESNRMSFSSLYSLNSAIYNGTRGLSGPSSVAGSDFEVKLEGPAQGTTTATSSLSVTTSSQNGSLGPKLSPTTLLFPSDPQSRSAYSANPSPSSLHASTSPQSGGTPHLDASRRSRTGSRTTVQGRLSGSTGVSSSPASREMKEPGVQKKGIIGVCALESKARSKPARNIFGKLIDEFDLIIFGDKIILDEDVENWPVCDFLISFFSDGFPLDKAIAYAKLRKPFCVNDLPMQKVLWDRRLCLRILDNLSIPTPKRVEVNRDGGPRLPSPEFAKTLYERTGVKLPGPEDGTGGGIPAPQKVEIQDDGDTISVDGVTLTKPFVEKPVSGEDHNINIYYPKKQGGGGRRLFRKVNNKSSEKDDTLDVPRSITDPTSSYIYEQFLQVENAEDVKAYTVGPDYCHAETRKSPVVDGLVKRNPSGKEVRYVTRLTEAEAAMASRISQGFAQRVCGFDLLRCGDKSYVIDVNGWSFVKDNESYYDRAASILRDMFYKEIQRRERKEAKQTAAVEGGDVTPEKGAGVSRKNTTSHRSALKGIFKSPSMSRLAAHHPHLHSRSQQPANVMTSSPEASVHSTPMASSPSFEKPNGSGMASAAKSDPEFTLPPPVSDASLDLDEATPSAEEPASVQPPASKAQWKLKGVVSVIRHADRTPKQKFKYTFHTKPFVDLLRGHQEEVLLIGEAALNSVADAVKQAMREGIEDPKKLRELQICLNKKGGWAGTKVQIKPMFRKRRREEIIRELADEHTADNQAPSNPLTPEEPTIERSKSRSDSMSGVTLSRIAAVENNLVLDKLQLIIKWGGEPTHSARYQAQDLGTNFRKDLMLMNKGILNDVAIYSSSERRVTTSAQIFAAAFMNIQEFKMSDIQIRKSLLDDSNAAKDEMDKVKKKLKTLLREGDKAPPQFAWPKEGVPEPYLVVRQVVDLMKFHQKVMNHNFKKIDSGAASSLSAITNSGGETASSGHVGSFAQATAASSIQSRWCCGEGPELFKERWEKLFKEFADADKVDPSKISELYDTMKFDALHNRQFLEWVFTPDPTVLDEETISETVSNQSVESQPRPAHSPMEPPKPESKERVSTDRAPERGSISQRIGFRRRSEAASKSVPPPALQPQESYFTLFTGHGAPPSKAKTDARLVKLRDMYRLSKVLFDYIGPQEYGIDNHEKLEIGLLTSLPLLQEVVRDLEELQASDSPKAFFYFTKESHIYTLLNCILEGGIKTKIARNAIPELDYLSQICFELYESQNATPEDEPNSFNYSIRITLSPGCHAFAPLDVQLDSKHTIGFSPRRSLTAHHDYNEVLETLRAKFHTVKLPKSFVAINLSEKDDFRNGKGKGKEKENDVQTAAKEVDPLQPEQREKPQGSASGSPPAL